MHQWFVKSGRIGIVLEGNRILLDVDPESKEKCLLTAQDALEITEILTPAAHEIWSSQTEPEEYVQQYEEIEPGQYQWSSLGSEIVVGISSDNESIELSLKGKSPFELSVNQAVEFIFHS